MNTGSHTRKKVIDVEAEHQLCGECTGVAVVVRWRHVTADLPPAVCEPIGTNAESLDLFF